MHFVENIFDFADFNEKLFKKVNFKYGISKTKKRKLSLISLLVNRALEICSSAKD